MKFYQKPREHYIATAKCKVAFQTTNELASSITDYIFNHIDGKFEDILYLPYYNMTTVAVTNDIENYLINNGGELTISVNTENHNQHINNSDVNVFEFLYQHIAYLQTSHYMIVESCWIRGDSIEARMEYIDQGASPINVDQILNSYFEVN